MASKAKIVVTGHKRIDAKLRKLGDETLAKKVVRQAIRAALKPVLAAARANVPRDKGTFAKLIKIRTRRSRKGIILIVGLSKKDLAAANAALGSAKGFYPIAVEFGTAEQPAQAPMRRAFDATATSARDNVLKLIKAGILSAAKG